MPRGVVPRQPAKTGRHEGARKIARGHISGGTLPKSKSVSHPPVRPKPATKKAATRKSYDPIAPQRVTEI